MDEFESLQAELGKVDNISALSRETGLSRDHLQRIRDGKVHNTTLKTMSAIREGIQRLANSDKAAA